MVSWASNIHIMHKLLFCFKGCDKQFIAVRKYGARYLNNEKQGSVTFSQSSLKKAVQYLLHNGIF